MNTFVAVVGTIESFHRINKLEKTWYCLSSTAKKDDLVYFYSTRNVSGKKSGLFSKYKIENIDPNETNQCSKYGGREFGSLIFANLLPIEIIEKPLSITRMKTSGPLRFSTFILRNFQGTCFNVTGKEQQEFERLINIDKNLV